jgi:NADP-reducing hydrogenase subunit HndB
MPRLKVEDLNRIKEERKWDILLREGKHRANVTVHLGTCGIAAGARDIMGLFMEELSRGGVYDVVVTTAGCAGMCSQEPMATVGIQNDGPVTYASLNAEKVKRIFKDHVQGGTVVEEYRAVIEEKAPEETAGEGGEKKGSEKTSGEAS